MKFAKYVLVLFLFLNCSSSETISQEPIDAETDLYFPPINSDEWETVSTADLGWNETAKQDLIAYLDETNTDSFIILYDGKIAMEYYFGNSTQFTNSPWFSAGKTLTAFTVGIAEQEGYLDLNLPSSTYLGSGWSSLTATKENAITVENHLMMTTGLDYTGNLGCTDPECLTFLNNPNERWYYHNAPYTLTQSIISGAVNASFDDYFEMKLKSKIGMDGFWFTNGYNKFYVSTARSMARFGLLNYYQGKWEDEQILNEDYFFSMTNTSQNLNLSYGYLWWLNGKASHVLPGSIAQFDRKLIPNAPDDLIAGLGADDKKLYVVPSKKLVVIRLGESANASFFGPSGYDNELWEKIMAVVE